MPLVIIESADGGGKTTLANQLLKGTGHPTLLVKRSGPPGSIETLEFQAKWLKDQADSGLNIIADRHPIISDQIYGPILRGDPLRWPPDQVAQAMKDKDILLIYCRPRLGTMLVGSRVEAQMEGVHDNYDALVREYDRWFRIFEDWGLPLIRYNYENTPIEVPITAVRKFWEGAIR